MSSNILGWHRKWKLVLSIPGKTLVTVSRDKVSTADAVIFLTRKATAMDEAKLLRHQQ
jgi:CTP:molybdopterin cytidylyltransferase MocA